MSISSAIHSPIASAVRAAITTAHTGRGREQREEPAGTDSVAPSEHPSRGRGPRVVPGAVDDAVRAAIASVRSRAVEAPDAATDITEEAGAAAQAQPDGEVAEVAKQPLLAVQQALEGIHDAIHDAIKVALSNDAPIDSAVAAAPETSTAVVAPLEAPTADDVRLAYDSIAAAIRQAVTFTIQNILNEQSVGELVENLVVEQPSEDAELLENLVAEQSSEDAESVEFADLSNPDEVRA